jgi:tetratricopeptide (TPR) repeat protein
MVLKLISIFVYFNDYLIALILNLMKKITLLLFLAISISFFAQDMLVFNKKFIQSENQWVAFQADSLGSHILGFIYIDLDAGLTLDYAGTFMIDENGKFVLKKKENDGFMKYRLENNNTLVSFVPETRFQELGIQKTPDWLSYYAINEKSAKNLHRKGYLYNGMGACEKALEFLDKAYKIDPDFKGLRVEMGYSYNCLGQFQKAIDILKLAQKNEPKNAYVNKEVLYAQVNNKQIEDAIKTYQYIVKNVEDTTYHSENAFNILGYFYDQKDLKKFNDWIQKTKIDEDKKFAPYVAQLKKELSK